MAELLSLEEYNQLTHCISGCAMTVHRKLGRGFPEVVYQRALAIELFKQGLRAERKIDLPIYHDNEKSVPAGPTFSLRTESLWR